MTTSGESGKSIVEKIFFMLINEFFLRNDISITEATRVTACIVDELKDQLPKASHRAADGVIAEPFYLKRSQTSADAAL